MTHSLIRFAIIKENRVLLSVMQEIRAGCEESVELCHKGLKGDMRDYDG